MVVRIKTVGKELYGRSLRENISETSSWRHTATIFDVGLLVVYRLFGFLTIFYVENVDSQVTW